MKGIIIVALAMAAIGCESEGEGSGTDSSSRFERGMERVGKGIETAAGELGTEVSEARIQMILDNIKGMGEVQAEITAEGSVTLIGTVENDAYRAEAERLVLSIEGVTNVQNAIEVGPVSGDSAAATTGADYEVTGGDSTKP